MIYKTNISTNVLTAASLLSDNEVVAIPTETVYGLAGNALSENVVKKIYEIKQRPFFNPLIVHIHDNDQLQELVMEIPDAGKELIRHFWPGPLTLLLEKRNVIPDIVTAGLKTVAVRMPDHKLTTHLLRSIDFPLAAPSANLFKQISPTSAEHVYSQLGGKIPFILDGGKCTKGLESTIVGFEKDALKIYRQGAVTAERIKELIPEVEIQLHKTNAQEGIKAPGQLIKHYAPQTPLILTTDIQSAIQENIGLEIGVVCFSSSKKYTGAKIALALSPQKNLSEAARHLYGALHTLDNKSLDIIIAEKFPDEGLGRVINDRLLRASS